MKPRRSPKGPKAAADSRPPEPARRRGLAVSWLFAPYVGSADIDFFRRIKDLDADFDVLMVKRDVRDEALLQFERRKSLNRIEIEVAAPGQPRLQKTRRSFLDGCLAHFEAHRDEYDFLISHSNEVHSHRAAYELKKRSGLPWIAYFGDPSEKNPYVRYLPDYPFFEEDNRTERLAFEHADRLVFNNHYQRRLMLEGMDRHLAKSDVVLHAYDPAWYLDAGPVENPRFTFGHFGTLYQVKRTAANLLRAIDRLVLIYPEYRDRFVVEFYGNIPYKDLKLHRKMRYRDNARLRGQVGYVESLRRMQRMDALVLIDAFFTADEDGLDFNPFLPCKLTDYFGAMKPIAGITMARGLPGELLAESGNLLATENPDSIAFVLKRYIDRKVPVDYGVYRRFSSDRQAAGMQAVVDSQFAREVAA